MHLIMLLANVSISVHIFAWWLSMLVLLPDELYTSSYYCSSYDLTAKQKETILALLLGFIHVVPFQNKIHNIIILTS